jgi:hypothetical protein
MLDVVPHKSDHSSSALNPESVQAVDLLAPSPLRRTEPADEARCFLLSECHRSNRYHLSQTFF